MSIANYAELIREFALGVHRNMELSPPPWVCLFVDMSGSFLAGQWRQSTDRSRLGMELKFAYDADEALEMISSLPVAVLIVATSAKGKDIGPVLRGYQDMVGCFADFQAIVADDPSPTALANYYEFGIDQIIPTRTWQEDLKRLIHDSTVTLADMECLETKALTITSQLKHSRQIDGDQAESHLGREDFDHRSAFSRGRIRERAGDYDGASVSFARARQLNRRFIPASSKLAETFLVLGKHVEAIEIYEELERKNPNNADRKAMLATAYVAQGNVDRAKELLRDAETLAPDNARLLEARSVLAMRQGDYKGAVTILSTLKNLGTYMAQCLNNAGVHLARENNIPDALRLYELAHDIVEPHLRHKIDMNAALACYKAGLHQRALQFLERCESEHGGSFDKLERVRKNVMKALRDNAA